MPSAELSAALAAARAAASVIQALYRHNLAVQLKADRSPVTEADVRAEQVIRALLSERFPGFGFHGEETGSERLDAESVWLVDPIDGTKSFVLGVSSAPAYGELAWAEAGQGAFLDGQPIRVSAITALSQAILSSGNLKTLAASTGWARFGDLVGRVNRLRGYGDFLHYHLLARGALDVVIESDVNILDIAALSVIVNEAGGTFTDLDGGEVALGTTTVLASNGALHAPVLAAMRG
jgi:histidinol-phosphatase